MSFSSRKFYVWLIALGAVFVIYLLYSWVSETPQIDIETPGELAGTIADSNVDEFDSEIGMVGDVGVGTVQKARFITLNKERQVEREFGFEKLLHEEGDEWELEKPYIKFFRPNFECHITSDRGKVRVEIAAGRPSPKDAILAGNVVIHILPETSSDIKESFIYLDDIVFISERSQFSTAGPVKFVSEDARMLGTGAELVYNDEVERLEFLRIVHLDSLNLRQSSLAPASPDARPGSGKASLFSSRERKVDSPAGTESQAQTELSAEPPTADVPQEAKPTPPASPVRNSTKSSTIQKGKISNGASRQVAEQREGEEYKCVFSKNVVIDTPDQLIFADELSINNILFSNGSSKKTNKAAAGDIVNTETLTEVAKGSTGPEQSEEENLIADAAASGNVSIASGDEPDESAEQPFDIVVTCDNGILVTPMDSRKVPKDFAKLKPQAAITGDRGSKSIDDANGRVTFVARKISHDYGTSGGSTVASGPLELTFYPNDVTGAEVGKTVPVKITAQEKAEFLPELNQVVFEGDCLCTMLQEEPKTQRKYTVSAPKLTIYLSEKKPEQPSDSAPDVKHLTASGGVVQLATAKMAGEELLGFIKLKCLRFDYDPERRMFSATGPGIIAVDNSKILRPKKKVGKFSLRRQCYVLVEGFDSLRYFSESNRIIADSETQQIHIGYIPIVRGREGRIVRATASHIEALLYETAIGSTELSKLSATGGVTYQEEADKKKSRKRAIQFIGSEFFYDAGKSMITARGDGAQPCFLNGGLVDGIKYNLKTGRIKAAVVGPGALQMK